MKPTRRNNSKQKWRHGSSRPLVYANISIMDNQLVAQCEQVAKQWIDSDCYDAETKKAVKAMVENSDKTELIDSFTKRLSLVLVVCVALWALEQTV